MVDVERGHDDKSPANPSMGNYDSSALLNGRDSTSTATLIVLTIGIATLFSTLLVYSSAMIPFLRLEHGETIVPSFVLNVLLVAALIGITFTIFSAKGKHIPTVLLTLGGGLGYLCCSFLFILYGWTGAADTPATVMLAIVTALSDVCLVVLWGRICARRLRSRAALIVIALSSVVSAGLCFLYSQLPLMAFSIAFVSASFIAVAIPLLLFRSDHATAHQPSEPPEAPLTGDETYISPANDFSKFASFAQVLCAPGLGILAFAFVVAMLRYRFQESQNAYLSMLALVGACLFLYALFRHKRFSLQGGIHQMLLPLLAITILAVTGITEVVGTGIQIVSFLTYALYSLAIVMTFSTLCAVSNAGEFPADVVFSLAIALFAAASFAGQVTALSLTDDAIEIIVTVTTLVYAAFLVITSYIRSQQAMRWNDEEASSQRSAFPTSANEVERGRNDDSVPPVDSPVNYEERCGRIAKEFRLTAREGEILTYLAEGHNGAYIADLLFISPNTARTHIHNIYRKLNVSSREDILRLTRG